MSDSRPPIFDDGGGLPEVDRSRHADADGPRPSGGQEPGPRRRPARNSARSAARHPNFLVRRAIAVGSVVGLVVVASIVAGRLIGGDDGRGGSDFGNTDWNRVVTLDGAGGTLVIFDAAGEETNRYRFGQSLLTDHAVVGTTLIGLDADSLAVVPLEADGEVTIADDVNTIQIESTGTLVQPSGSTQTLVAQGTNAERLVFVNGSTRDVIDTADATTVPGARYDLVQARTDPAGRHVLVTDTGNFQSVLFSFDRDEPSFFPGLALAVDDDIVVTAQNVGANANIAVFDHAGEPGVAAQTATVRAGMITDGNVVLVGVDGEILGLSLTTGEITEIGSLSVGTVESGHVAVRGDRLTVVGTQGTAVVDGGGEVLADLPGSRPTTTGIDAIAPSRSDCLVIEREAGGEVAVIDLEDGAVVAEAIADPDVLPTVDGCSPIVPTSSGYVSLTRDGVTSITMIGDVVALSPDGGTIAVERANRVELVARATTTTATDDTDEDAGPVDIGRSGRELFFVDL